MKNKWIKFCVCIIVGLIIWNLPIPAHVTPKAWHLLAIFVATIIGFILQPFSIGVVTFIAVTLSSLTGILKPNEALSGFSSTTVWLIISAFLFSRGFIKTGLGKRVAYILMSKFGDSSLKLGYTLAISDLIISPCIPSNTARAGGIMFPIVCSLSDVFGSKPGKTAKKIGAYLIQTVYQSDLSASAMTITAMAGNVLIVNFAATTIGLKLTWGMWALAAIVPALISTLIIPYFLYKCFPPEIKETPESKKMALKELESMGSITLQEKILLVIFLVSILGWSTSQFTGLDSTIIAMAAVSIMLLSNVITWHDLLSEKSAWDAMIWMGGILGLANNLSNLKIFNIFAQAVKSKIISVPWVLALIILLLIYAFSTYAFASGIAHIVAMYPVFLSVAVASGAPPYLAAFAFGFASALYQGLTHYASGPSAIFFSAGYIEQKTWWCIGLVVFLVNVVIWSTSGVIWWKILGLW